MLSLIPMDIFAKPTNSFDYYVEAQLLSLANQMGNILAASIGSHIVLCGWATKNPPPQSFICNETNASQL